MRGPTVERTFHIKQSRRSRKALAMGNSQQAPAQQKVPRISRLMALAIRFDQLIRDGVVADYAELAQLGQVSRARVTQIMNLLSLAPDLQEKILFLSPFDDRSYIAERQLRPIAAALSWRKQRRLWAHFSRPTNGRAERSLLMRSRTMHSPRPGNRIELIAMPNDPDPVPAGTKGTIQYVGGCGTARDRRLQLGVDWDNGRKLMLVVPPDQFIVLDGSIG